MAGRLPAFSSPVYRRFIAGAFAGNVGSWMQATAQGWLVLDLTNSPSALGITSAAGAVPILLLSVIGGVLADRVDRARMLAATQLAGAALSAILALLTIAGVVRFEHVVVIAFLAGSASAIAIPAFQAVISTIVQPGAIGSAIALNSAQFNVARIIGPVVAGAAIAVGLLPLAFVVNAIALTVVAIVIARLPLGRPAEFARVEASLWANLLDGFRYVRSERTVALLLLLAAVPALFVLNYIVLMPVFARDVLAIGPEGLGILNGGLGVGALAGALFVAVLRPGGGSGRLLLAGLAAGAIALIVFSASRWVPLSVAALAVLGACQVAYYATTNTLIQILAPARLRGRVLSLYILTSLGVIPFGNLLAGLLAEAYGAPLALAIGGTATLVIVLLVALAAPSLRRLRPTPPTATPSDRPPEAPAAAASA